MRRLPAVAFAGSILVAVASLAAESPAVPTDPNEIAQPAWLKGPTIDDVGRVYPERAKGLGISGRATVHCQVTAQGRLQTCQVVMETPPNTGFGAAALKLASGFQLRQPTDGSSLAGRTVTVPMLFGHPKPL